MKIRMSAQAALSFLVTFGLTFSGLGPATAGSVVASPDVSNQSKPALRGGSFVFREHPTANHERVDISDNRLDHVQDLHGINFSVLVRAIEWARSPRCKTSRHGNDRGIYKYRIYEYVVRDGDLEKTGRWAIIQSVIEWGDGHADRGWLVTAYPVRTNTGAPPQRNGKSWVPGWMEDSFAMGPVNKDVLCVPQ